MSPRVNLKPNSCQRCLQQTDGCLLKRKKKHVHFSALHRYKIIELLAYVAMGVLPALVILSMVRNSSIIFFGHSFRVLWGQRSINCWPVDEVYIKYDCKKKCYLNLGEQNIPKTTCCCSFVIKYLIQTFLRVVTGGTRRSVWAGHGGALLRGGGRLLQERRPGSLRPRHLASVCGSWSRNSLLRHLEVPVFIWASAADGEMSDVSAPLDESGNHCVFWQQLCCCEHSFGWRNVLMFQEFLPRWKWNASPSVCF